MRKHINLLRQVLNIFYVHLSHTGILNESFCLEITIIIWLILRIQDKKNNLHYTNCLNEEKKFFKNFYYVEIFLLSSLKRQKKMGKYKQIWFKKRTKTNLKKVNRYEFESIKPFWNRIYNSGHVSFCSH